MKCVNALETITILVTAGATLVGVVNAFRGGVLSRLGRDGVMWFDHIDDLPLDERPSEDDRDAPIPRRPLYTRAS